MVERKFWFIRSELARMRGWPWVVEAYSSGPLLRYTIWVDGFKRVSPLVFEGLEKGELDG